MTSVMPIVVRSPLDPLQKRHSHAATGLDTHRRSLQAVLMARYIRVRETLAKEIAEGHFPVGRRFPTDLELCERFGVSRHTVREALRDLQQAGVLDRTRGAGTTVLPPALSPYVQSLPSLSELDNYAAETRFELREEGVIIARTQMSEQLGCPVGSRWLRFAGLRYRKDDPNPLCWTEVLLTEELVAHRSTLLNDTGPFYDRVRRLKGWMAESVEQSIRAVTINQKFADLLNYPESAPALLVHRRYLRGEIPFEISVSYHPGDRYISSTRLTRRHLKFSA